MKKVILLIAILFLLVASAVTLAACAPAPVGISVTLLPTKTGVPQGVEPNLSGGVVTVTYDDNSTLEVPMTDLTWQGLDVNSVGKQTLVLVYTEGNKSFSTTIEYTVTLPKAKKLTLSTENVKTTYLVGESFDKKGLVVYAELETGEVVTAVGYDLYAPDSLTLDTTSVRISYRGVSATIPITVVNKKPIAFTVTAMPSKTEYFVGDPFLPDGFETKVTYNDGAEETFTLADNADKLSFTHPFGGTYSAPISQNDDRVTVTVGTAYGAISGDFSLTVTPVLPVELTAKVAGELVFVEESEFTFGDEEEKKVTITVKYNNDTQEDMIATDDLFSHADGTLALGQTSVEVALWGYPDVTTTIPITVRAAKVVAFEILTSPTNLTATSDPSSVDLTGLSLLVTDETNRTYSLSYSSESGIRCIAASSSASYVNLTIIYRDLTKSLSVFIGE